MLGNNSVEENKDVLKNLESEEKRIREILLADAADFEELQSDWQERDSAAERNLREVEWNQYSQLKDELSEIEDAKQRVSGGTYGVCEDCNEEISAKRLSIVPTARRCIKCQEQIEKDSGKSRRNVTL